MNGFIATADLYLFRVFPVRILNGLEVRGMKKSRVRKTTNDTIDAESIKSYKTIVSPIRGPNQFHLSSSCLSPQDRLKYVLRIRKVDPKKNKTKPWKRRM